MSFNYPLRSSSKSIMLGPSTSKNSCSTTRFCRQIGWITNRTSILTTSWVSGNCLPSWSSLTRP
jgi:hypothetical protein